MSDGHIEMRVNEDAEGVASMQEWIEGGTPRCVVLWWRIGNTRRVCTPNPRPAAYSPNPLFKELGSSINSLGMEPV